MLNHELINNFLGAVFPLPKHFGITCDGAFPIGLSTLNNSILNVDPSASIEYGMSKMVIISPSLDVVIKIPFNGYFYRDIDEKKEIWTPFTCAAGSDSSDYCLTEFEKYEELKENNLDCFVAKTDFYKEINNTRIFLQEKVIPQNNLVKDYIASKDSKKLAYKWYEEGEFDVDYQWMANCIDAYGESKVKEFLDYCNRIDYTIFADLHSGNIGYRDNQTPCILDFSGYED